MRVILIRLGYTIETRAAVRTTAQTDEPFVWVAVQQRLQSGLLIASCQWLQSQASSQSSIGLNLNLKHLNSESLEIFTFSFILVFNFFPLGLCIYYNPSIFLFAALFLHNGATANVNDIQIQNNKKYYFWKNKRRKWFQGACRRNKPFVFIFPIPFWATKYIPCSKTKTHIETYIHFVRVAWVFWVFIDFSLNVPLTEMSWGGWCGKDTYHMMLVVSLLDNKCGIILWFWCNNNTCYSHFPIALENQNVWRHMSANGEKEKEKIIIDIFINLILIH